MFYFYCADTASFPLGVSNTSSLNIDSEISFMVARLTFFKERDFRLIKRTRSELMVHLITSSYVHLRRSNVFGYISLSIDLCWSVHTTVPVHNIFQGRSMSRNSGPSL